MKTLEMAGYFRKEIRSKSNNKQLRKDGNVPCVMYGGKEVIHFTVPAFLFREVVYTPNAYEIHMDIEGSLHKCILQDVQFHPVSEMIMHADFLELGDGREVKMELPVVFTGTAVGISQGGKLVPKLRKVKVQGIPANMPDVVEVDITNLELGKSVKISELKPEGYTILANSKVTIATITIPRALKGK